MRLFIFSLIHNREGPIGDNALGRSFAETSCREAEAFIHCSVEYHNYISRTIFLLYIHMYAYIVMYLRILKIYL